MALKDAYTTRELAEVFGYSTTRSVFLRAEREAWQFRKRAGRGGGKEWLVSSMPEETRLVIRTAEEKHAVAVCSEKHRDLSPVTTAVIMDDTRRYKALAKADLVRPYKDTDPFQKERTAAASIVRLMLCSDPYAPKTAQGIRDACKVLLARFDISKDQSDDQTEV